MKKFLITVVLYSFTLVFLFLFLIVMFLYSTKSDFELDREKKILNTKPSLISHACGAIKLNNKFNIYTNSLEACNEAVLLNFEYIELDLFETKDGKLIALHDWKRFKAHINYHDISERDLHSNHPLDSKELLGVKILDGLTVVYPEDIRRLLNNNESLIIVTDKIQNFELIEHNFPVDRVLVEVFSLKKYIEAKYRGLTPILSINPETPFIDIILVLLNIESITLKHKKNYSLKTLEKIKNIQKSGIRTYIYTINDIDDFLLEHVKNSTGVYTDYLYYNEEQILRSKKYE